MILRLYLRKRKIIINLNGYVWVIIYNNLLIENNIKFLVGIHYEDSMFNTLTLLYADSIAKADKSLYYLIRDNSSSNSNNQKILYDRIETTELMFKEVNKRKLYEKYKSLLN